MPPGQEPPVDSAEIQQGAAAGSGPRGAAQQQAVLGEQAGEQAEGRPPPRRRQLDSDIGAIVLGGGECLRRAAARLCGLPAAASVTAWPPCGPPTLRASLACHGRPYPRLAAAPSPAARPPPAHPPHAEAEGEEVSEPLMHRRCYAGHLNLAGLAGGGAVPLAPPLAFLGVHSGGRLGWAGFTVPTGWGWCGGAQLCPASPGQPLCVSLACPDAARPVCLPAVLPPVGPSPRPPRHPCRAAGVPLR